ncbi:hypothetical protein OQA88_1299 [Cercophora sp. LCS_1]
MMFKTDEDVAGFLNRGDNVPKTSQVDEVESAYAEELFTPAQLENRVLRKFTVAEVEVRERWGIRDHTLGESVFVFFRDGRRRAWVPRELKPGGPVGGWGYYDERRYGISKNLMWALDGGEKQLIACN